MQQHKVKDWISRFGVLLKIHFYQGRIFELALFQDVYQILLFKKTRTSLLQSQLCGIVGRMNNYRSTRQRRFLDKFNNKKKEPDYAIAHCFTSRGSAMLAIKRKLLSLIRSPQRKGETNQLSTSKPIYHARWDTLQEVSVQIGGGLDQLDSNHPKYIGAVLPGYKSRSHGMQFQSTKGPVTEKASGQLLLINDRLGSHL